MCRTDEHNCSHNSNFVELKRDWFTTHFGFEEDNGSVSVVKKHLVLEDYRVEPSQLRKSVGHAMRGFFDLSDKLAMCRGKSEVLNSNSAGTAIASEEGSQLTLKSTATGQSYGVGSFDTPSLAVLRARRARAPPGARAGLVVSNVVGDVSALHSDPANQHATFMVASQFNCLEFVSPSVLPEDGVTRYQWDRTQGPACAIACGAATVYRNYFMPLRTRSGKTQPGQTAKAQIENLAGVETLLDNETNGYFEVRGGYTLSDSDGLERLNARLSKMSPKEKDLLQAALRVGVQSDAEVTSENWGKTLTSTPDQTVTQVFASACSVSYNSSTCREEWEAFASLILEASYEATLLAAAETAARHKWIGGSTRVFLTALGAGAFGNSMHWVTAALDRACERCRDLPLDVRVVTFGAHLNRGVTYDMVPQGLRLLETKFFDGAAL